MRSKKDKGASRLFEGLKAGLEDVIAYKKGKLTLASEEIEIPELPVTHKAKDLKKEYLERCKGMTPDQIIEFLENYRMLFSKTQEKSQLISLKIEPALLNAFKQKAQLAGIPYQTQIKKLMRDWLKVIAG